MLADWIDLALKIAIGLLFPLVGLCAGMWARINRVHARVDQLERDVSKLPNADAANDLKLEIEELRGETRVLGERMEGLNTALIRNGEVLTRVEQFLLTNGGGKS